MEVGLASRKTKQCLQRRVHLFVILTIAAGNCLGLRLEVVMAFTPRSFYAKQEYNNKLFVNCKDAFKG
jgi:Ni,Fe-hydrogenase III small subunit